jgi:hypothetical protein
VLPAALAWAALCALTVTGKSTRDALFCAYFPTAELPKTMMAGAALSALFALGSARLSRRRGPAWVLPPLLCVNALGFAGWHAALDSAPRAVALLIYLHVSAVTGLILSGFWSVVNERFDPHALRHSISRTSFLISKPTRMSASTGMCAIALRTSSSASRSAQVSDPACRLACWIDSDRATAGG